ncbi:MAG: tetratricopeptide repeat protein, partial [Blastocatellia bacterium]|nr:tetratricopeptide repeat protein [Blastocatellia bacterium]
MQRYFLLVFCMITFNSAVVKAQNSRASSAASYVERGDDSLARGNLDWAIADYDLAIATDPGLPTAYLHRGEAHSAKGDLAGAIADYTKALEINPRMVEAYNNRG